MNYLPDAAPPGRPDLHRARRPHHRPGPDGRRWIVHVQPLGVGRDGEFHAPPFSVTVDLVVLAAGTVGTTGILLRSEGRGTGPVGPSRSPLHRQRRRAGIRRAATHGGAGARCGSSEAPVRSIPPVRASPPPSTAARSRCRRGAHRGRRDPRTVGRGGGGRSGDPVRRRSPGWSSTGGSGSGRWSAWSPAGTGGRPSTSRPSCSWVATTTRAGWSCVTGMSAPSGPTPPSATTTGRATAILGPRRPPTARGPTWGDPLSSRLLHDSLITVHPLGGCVMAERSEDGVVDHRGRPFDGPTGEGGPRRAGGGRRVDRPRGARRQSPLDHLGAGRTGHGGPLCRAGLAGGAPVDADTTGGTPSGTRHRRPAVHRADVRLVVGGICAPADGSSEQPISAAPDGTKQQEAGEPPRCPSSSQIRATTSCQVDAEPRTPMEAVGTVVAPRHSRGTAHRARWALRAVGGR